MSEHEFWKTSTTILVIISLIIGLVQRTQYQFLDVLFEVCVFHIPTIMSLVIYSKVPQ